jgi:hypothetical protein
MTLCMPPEDGVAATERLLRPAFGIYRVEWPGNPGVEFHLSHGDWIRLLRRSGFEVEDFKLADFDLRSDARYQRAGGIRRDTGGGQVHEGRVASSISAAQTPSACPSQVAVFMR